MFKCTQIGQLKGILWGFDLQNQTDFLLHVSKARPKPSDSCSVTWARGCKDVRAEHMGGL